MPSRGLPDNAPPVALSHPRSVVTEAYRTVRTNVQFASVVRDAKVLLVTSSVPSEGKTSTSTNLAVVSAQVGRKVLLVDCDLRKPQVHQRFQISNLDGLSSILVRESSPENCIVASAIPGLSLITSGPIPPNPAELLASDQFLRLISTWRESFDLVILDAPPVLSVADALQITRAAEGVVLVVDAQRTARKTAQKATAMLRQVNAPLMGAVMNRQSVKRSGEYYYYYQSYANDVAKVKA